MKKVVICKEPITREKLENPFLNDSLHDRLVKSKAIDLSNNHAIEDLGNGYCKILAIDKSKLIKP